MGEYYHDRSDKDESRVINALIIEPESRQVIFDRLTPGHFADQTGRRLFEAMLSCWKRNISLDADGNLQTIAPAGDGRVDDFLSYGMPGQYNAHWRDSIEVLDRYEFARRVLRQAHLSSEAVQAANVTRSELIARIAEMWEPVLASPMAATTVPLRDVIQREHQRFRESQEGTRIPAPWGLRELDRKVPVYPGQMVILAARPGMGKSALMVTSVLAQVRSGMKVGIISVEMEDVDLLRRFYSQISGISYRELDAGFGRYNSRLLEERIAAYERSRQVAGEWDGKLFLHGGEKCSTERVKAIAYDWVKSHGVEAIWLDYLTDFSLPRRRDYHLSVEAASQEFRDLSRPDKLNVPVYLLAQLNRGSADSYPRMSHLKGSSGLEQDPHVVVLIDRPDIDPTSNRPYLGRGGAVRDMQGKAALHIAKNRNGSTGIVYSTFDGPRMQFGNESEYADEEVPI